MPNKPTKNALGPRKPGYTTKWAEDCHYYSYDA